MRITEIQKYIYHNIIKELINKLDIPVILGYISDPKHDLG